MKLMAMVAMAAVIGTNAEAGQKPAWQATVYLSDNASVPDLVKARAEGLATSMFATAGVRIDWRPGTPKAFASTEALGIELAISTAADLPPHALAYALPFEGVHIRVFWDRLQVSSDPSRLLAHVFVHEITHILEGTDRHSDSGIMKARWTGDDLALMQLRPMPFTPEDLALIQRGLTVRNSVPPALMAAKKIPAAGEASVK